MARISEVDVRTRSVERFASIVSEEQMRGIREIGDVMRPQLEGRVLWHVNTTSVGGGVAEMLRQHVGYGRGSGIDTRWLVISGGPEFFRITKRLHHALHGAAGDGSPLGERERGVYEETLRQNTDELLARVRPRDVVWLHDPQTAGLATPLLRSGATVMWRCHVGYDHVNEEIERGWDFLRPYLQDVPVMIFTRDSYVPSAFRDREIAILEPSIDAFSPKNWDLEEESVRTILVHVGLVEGPLPAHAAYRFERSDGTTGRVERQADVIRLGRAPAWDTPLVVQVSRWDPLKDPRGVMQGFADLVQAGAAGDAELVLAGPNVTAVADDPEGALVFEDTLAAWRALPHKLRSRVHLASLPTHDVEENAVIVNALQRHANIVVQKSLVEGFGLTVTEAMWKGRPVVASAVGGIQDQIEDGISGLLVKDPTDLDAYGAALRTVLGDRDLAERLGGAARQRAKERFLDSANMLRQAMLVHGLVRDGKPA